MTSTSSREGLLELLFQIVLHIVVFIFYYFDRENPQVQPYQLAFFANYALAVLVVNYYLLPRFLYPKKYLMFVFWVAVLMISVVLIEEFVLEKIFFPDTRGSDFQGFFYVLLDVMPVVAILSGFKFAWDLIRKQRELEKLKASVEKSELNFLKSQINPHFLFNNLNNLYSYALENSDKTPEIILELSSVLRYMLYDCQSEYVPLRNEIQHLKNFVRLNELQIEERGQVDLDLGQTPEGNLMIAPLILMTFVENAFKHSLGSQVDDISIQMKFRVNEKGQLHFHCENSYHENTNNENLNKGIGLENVQKRLELIYPKAHRLHLEKEKERYKVDLRINLSSQ